MRGGVCVGIPQVWGDWCLLAKCLIPQVWGFWLSALPLVRGCICWREELCTPGCIYPNPQWRFPVWEVLCGRVSGNPSVWRRGRRAMCSNLKTYPCVCLWSTFTNSPSFILCLASFILLIHTYMLGCVCLCASLVFNQELHIAPQLLIREIKRS